MKLKYLIPSIALAASIALTLLTDVSDVAFVFIMCFSAFVLLAVGLTDIFKPKK